jgi:hypothetical protein
MSPSPGFKIGDAYRFASAHGLEPEAKEIRSMIVHPTIRKPHGPRKGRLVDLFESRGVMAEFAAEYWPTRQTEIGEARRQSYLDAKALNERLLRGEPADEDTDSVPGTSDGGPVDTDLVSFALEAQLRDFIVKNLSRIPIGGRRLRVYTDATGREGREYPTGVGPIDILAVDDSGNFFVFELKLERGPDRALGQLARYMGWVKIELASDREVRGVVVARSIDERLRYAACVIPNIVLLEYEVEFRVREVGSIATQPNIAESA